ncbi:MAG: hypothetical protein GY860_06930 [Desulfobacteraceae bacterium]|nr:hypothetical protein [Desulfobacteraceae bacterium]
MEDISRELEKEITQLKPSPYKKSKKKRILIVDDFGEIKPAGHLKVIVYILFVTSLVSFIAASGLYYLFSNQALENKLFKSELIGLKKKVDDLINEKEVLMARLVISGKKPGIEAKAAASVVLPITTAKEKKPGIKEKPDPGSVNAPKAAIVAKADSKPKGLTPIAEIIAAKEKENLGQPILKPKAPVQHKAPVQQIVTIEKFSVTRDGAEGDLLVRFDIRNISDQPGGVSGRIFTILKPGNNSRKDWLVVPAVPLIKGVPSLHRKGQYFSIAHFKPVKFRIENQAGPDFFKKAAIYIFNENGDLMFESLIDITEEEPSL